MKIFSEERALELTEKLLQNDKDIKENLENVILPLPNKVQALEEDSHNHNNEEVLNNITTEKTKYWDGKAEISDIPNIEGLASESFVVSEIAKAQLVGGEVDLSAYVDKDMLDKTMADYSTTTEIEKTIDKKIAELDVEFETLNIDFATEY